MTVLAEIARIDMKFVFAGGIDAIVAALAVVDDVFVFKLRRCPGGSNVMALFAIVMCGHVFFDFAPGSLSIMTTYTIVCDAGVIHARGNGEIGR